jgi:hypothetical protein
MGTNTTGSSPISATPNALALSCFRYSYAGIFDSTDDSNALTKRCAIRVWATSPARRQTRAIIAIESAVATPTLKSEIPGM